MYYLKRYQMNYEEWNLWLMWQQAQYSHSQFQYSALGYSILTATCSLAGWEPNIKELIRRPRLDSTPADACRAWQLIVFCNPDSNRSSFVVVAKINPCGYRGQQNEKSKHVSSHMVVLYCNIREYKLLGLELHLRLPIAWHNNTHY